MPKTYDGFNDFPPSPGIECTEPGARQSEAGEVDINTIVDRFSRTGTIPIVNQQPLYEDVSHVGDYREALERVKLADAAFMMLPPQVRSRFSNDPAEFLDFCSNPENRDEAVKLGLMAEKAPEAPASADTATAEPSA